MFSKSGFELMTCSRCGGSGNYSYCQSYGTRCFKCAGNKVCYTAKGKAAAEFYAASLKVPASTLVVGELIQIDDFFKGKLYFAEITAIEPDVQTGSKMVDGVLTPFSYPILKISTKHPKYGEMGTHVAAETMLRKGWGAEFKAAKLAAAIAYQATLTKAGKVSAKAAKAA
jgi:hypothetical protein